MDNIKFNFFALRRGYSLVEVLVALAIGGLAVLALSSIFTQSSKESAKGFSFLLRSQDSNSLFGFIQKNFLATDTKTYLPVSEGNTGFRFGQFPFFLANRCFDVDSSVGCPGDISFVFVRNQKPAVSSVCLVHPLEFKEQSRGVKDFWPAGDPGEDQAAAFMTANPNARLLVLSPYNDPRWGYGALVPEGSVSNSPVDWAPLEGSQYIKVSNAENPSGRPTSAGAMRAPLQNFAEGVIDFQKPLYLSANGKAYAFRPLPMPGGKSEGKTLFHLESKERQPKIGFVNISMDPGSAAEAHLPEECIQKLPLDPTGSGGLPTELVAVMVEPLFLYNLMGLSKGTVMGPNYGDDSDLDGARVSQLDLFSVGFKAPALPPTTVSASSRTLVLAKCTPQNGSLDCPESEILFQSIDVAKFDYEVRFGGALGSQTQIFRYILTPGEFVLPSRPSGCGSPNSDCAALAVPFSSTEAALAPFLDYGASPVETETALQPRRWSFVKNRSLLSLLFKVQYSDGKLERFNVNN